MSAAIFWKTFVTILALACWLADLAPLRAEPVPDRDTLLLVQFDRSADADLAAGTPTADTRARLVEGRFGRGIELGTGQQLSYVGNDGNFHPASGTIDFWIKPHWPGGDPNNRSIFTCRFGTRGYININNVGNHRLGIALSSGEGDAWRWRRAEADISGWQAEQWHHVACTWGNGQLRIYIDGQLGERTADDARMPDQLPQSLTFLGCDAVLDGVRISRRALTAEQVRQSIKQALGPPPYRFVDQLLDPLPAGCSPGGRTLLGPIYLPLVIGQDRFPRGLVCPIDQELSIPLGGEFVLFQAVAGLDAFSAAGDRVVFEVWGDGKRLYRSGPRDVRRGPLNVSVPVRGVQQLVLKAEPSGPVHATSRIAWANALVARQGAEPLVARPRPLKPAQIELYRRQQQADAYQFKPPAGSAFLLATKYWEDDLDPARPPAADQIGGPLKAMVVPGEYEPINFVVYAVEDLKQVRVEVSPLRGPGGQLPADQIDVRLVMRGLMRELYVRPPEQSRVVSRFLLANQPVDIPAGTLREYHLIVHVPERLAGGLYTGRVRIVPRSRAAAELPIQLEVLPFRLAPLTRKFYGIYYRFPTDPEAWEPVERELADIRRHGATMLKTNLGVLFRAADGRIRPDLEVLTKGLDLLRKLGFHGPLPVGSGCEQAARLLGYDPVADYGNAAARRRFLQLVKEAMTQLVALDRRYPEFELLATHMDEVFGRGRLERYIRLTEAVQQVPDLRVYITLHNSPRPGVEEMMRQCDPYVDVRCYNGHAMDEWIKAGHSFDQLRRQLEASGDEAWTYYNIRGAFFRPEWTRLVNGFYLWISPLRAHVPWMYYSYQGNPLDDTDGPRLRGHDFAYAVPDPTDPTQLIPTRHWEAYREGIDDMRYLCTLEDLIARHRSSPQAQAARRWLDSLRAALEPRPEELAKIDLESPILVLWSERYDGMHYRQFRRRAAEYIGQLLALDK